MAGSILGGILLHNEVLLDLAIALGLSTGILIGVAATQVARARPPESDEPDLNLVSVEPAGQQAVVAPAATQPDTRKPGARLRTRLASVGWIELAAVWIRDWFRNLPWMKILRIGTAVAGIGSIVSLLALKFPSVPPSPLTAGIAAGACLLAAGLAAIAAYYLDDIQASRLPEAAGLCRGARVIAWMFVLAAMSIGLAWAGQQKAFRILHFSLLAFNAAVCYGLLGVRRRRIAAPGTFPLDLGILSALGSRPNIVASILDSAERQFGIDLRSAWAFKVVRDTIEPLVLGLLLVAWLSTSLTVVGVDEAGLVERLGVPVAGQPLQPGLHLHWPWPVDRVFRYPVLRVQPLQVGHAGEEKSGPENVLWAVEHAPNEYSLLLGNGRDLVTIDAMVQYRISDARAWRYHTQNPADALRAIAYRAVLRNTVNLTLAQALSENLAVLTARMRDMMQQDADALGLGVHIVALTVGGMHPPVPVASAYEAVVSAELGEVTEVADAQAFMNQTVPGADADVLAEENSARADGANTLAQAAGDAWSFRTLEAQYRAAPEEFFFRRRLETLEKDLGSHSYVVVDSRFLRDGGEVWIEK
jgi:regulator of protease activity HflC (stomatin/prohibitin superfamily)